MSVYAKKEILVATESSFAEVSASFTATIPAVACRYETVSGKFADRSYQSRLWDTRPGANMPRSNGTFEIDHYAAGSLVDTATGSLVATELQKILAGAFGGSDLTQVGGVAGASATASTMPNRTGTGLRGGICRVGVAADARGNGQATVMSNPTTTLLVALDAAPNSGDVVRACQMVYPTDTGLGSSKRFCVGYADNAGLQYLFHGCHVEAVTLSISRMNLPMWTIRYRYAYWRTASVSIPSGNTMEASDATISAGGSDFLAAVGTSTRTLLTAVEMELTINMTLAAITAQGGAHGGLQTVVGFERLKADQDAPAGTLRLTVPANTTDPTDWDSDGSSASAKHFLATLSAGGGTATTEGRHLAIYCPRMYRIGARPAIRDWGGLQYMDVIYGLREGPDTTNDLTKSFVRFGMS